MLLSLCIPTFSRSEMLIELLESIREQDAQRTLFEVIVSDDSSTDDTLERLRQYSPNLPNLTVLTQQENIGFDRNFLEVAKHAKGDYLWFLGDDDKLEPGAISTVIKALSSHPNTCGMTLGSIDYDPSFTRPTGLKILPESQTLNSTEEVFTKIGDLLGFMSTLVIRRENWNAVCNTAPVQNFFKLYVQVYIIGKALQQQPEWLLLNEVCVGYRSDNDQFIRKLGWYERLAADVLAYHSIAVDLFGAHSFASRGFEAKIFDSHVRSRLVNGISSGMSKGSQIKAANLLLRHYYWHFKFWTFALPILLTPRIVVAKVRALYRSYAPTSGTQRAKKLLK